MRVVDLAGFSTDDSGVGRVRVPRERDVCESILYIILATCGYIIPYAETTANTSLKESHSKQPTEISYVVLLNTVHSEMFFC